MSDATSQVIIRPWHQGDELELTQLFQRAFGRAISVDHWSWKLRSELHAFDNVWLAVNEDKPIFQYAGIPIRFNLANRQVQAVVSVDTMTAPEFRRRGLLTLVAQKAYSTWREAEVAFVIGLPNENWGSRARALGWQPLFPLQWLVRPLRPEVILARRMRWPALRRVSLLGYAWNAALRHRVRPAADIQVEQVRQAGSVFDRIWERCKADWMFCTIRDRRWVQWRYFSAPSRRYEITVARQDGVPTGYLAHAAVHSEAGVSAYMAELCAARADVATRNSLLADLIDRLRETPAGSLHTLAIPGTSEFSWLRRAGFLPREAFTVQFVPLMSSLPVEQMLDRQRWSLTGADFDVV
jgi:hypothetical protein